MLSNSFSNVLNAERSFQNHVAWNGIEYILFFYFYSRNVVIALISLALLLVKSAVVGNK